MVFIYKVWWLGCRLYVSLKVFYCMINIRKLDWFGINFKMVFDWVFLLEMLLFVCFFFVNIGIICMLVIWEENENLKVKDWRLKINWYF